MVFADRKGKPVIDCEERILSDKAISIIDGIEVQVFCAITSRRSKARISVGGDAVEIEGFADRQFDAKARDFVPVCEVVRWGVLRIVAGLPALVVAGPGGLHQHELFRTGSENAGFYQMQWAEAGDRLLCAYERGLMGFDATGSRLWHRRKYWDDVFLGLEGTSIKLFTADEEDLVLDLESGEPRQSPTAT